MEAHAQVDGAGRARVGGGGGGEGEHGYKQSASPQNRQLMVDYY